MPGVTEEIYMEAHSIRHCALSLVGEALLYPYLKEFCNLLHLNNISTFLVNINIPLKVTNGQFPEQMKNMKILTQLYLSVDAPTKEEMYKIGNNSYLHISNRSTNF